LEAYLRNYVDYEQSNWVEFLPTAQFAYNSATSSTTKESPYRALYKREPTAYNQPIKEKQIAQQATIKVNKLKTVHKQMRRIIAEAQEKSAT